MKLDQNKVVWGFILFLLGVATGVGGLTMTKRVRPAPIMIVPPAPTATLAPTDTPGPILVYVNGQVAVPAVYQLPPGSRVQQAVEAAGGFIEDANTAVVNLALPLTDGAQVYVPAQDETVPMSVPIVSQPMIGTSGSGTVDSGGAGLVNINTASLEELDTLPGIGPSTAQKILNYRDENGLFTAVEEIMNVSGIGEAKFNQIKDLIIVGDN